MRPLYQGASSDVASSASSEVASSASSEVASRALFLFFGLLWPNAPLIFFCAFQAGGGAVVKTLVTQFV